MSLVDSNEPTYSTPAATVGEDSILWIVDFVCVAISVVQIGLPFVAFKA